MSHSGTEREKLFHDSALAPAGPFLRENPCFPQRLTLALEALLTLVTAISLLSDPFPCHLMNPPPVTVFMPLYQLFLCFKLKDTFSPFLGKILTFLGI